MYDAYQVPRNYSMNEFTISHNFVYSNVIYEILFLFFIFLRTTNLFDLILLDKKKYQLASSGSTIYHWFEWLRLF